MGTVHEPAFAPSHVSPSQDCLSIFKAWQLVSHREYFEGAKVWVVMSIVTSLRSQTLS